MKVLNLYAGIGGNRKLWKDVEVTAVESNLEIAEIYSDFFPDDLVMICDAHEFLLHHYSEYDFIWSSPPCPTHSDIRRCGVHAGQYKALYPDMKLYEEVILLKHFAPKNCKWVGENVAPYYKLLIPAIGIERHLFWSNFFIGEKIGVPVKKTSIENITDCSEIFGFNLNKYKINNKRKILRNIVSPRLGLHIFNESKIDLQPELFR